jgi:hypothetical protein
MIDIRGQKTVASLTEDGSVVAAVPRLYKNVPRSGNKTSVLCPLSSVFCLLMP